MNGYGVFNGKNVMVAWFNDGDIAEDFKGSINSTGRAFVKSVEIGVLHTAISEDKVPSEGYITIKTGDDIKEILEKSELKFSGEPGLTTLIAPRICKSREEWLALNPLTTYMFKMRKSFSEVSTLANEEGYIMLSLRLQKLAIGLEEPTEGEYAILARITNNKRIKEYWGTWFEMTPDNAFECI